MSSSFAPLDDVDIIGLLLMATVTFDCSGARFAEDVNEVEGSKLLNLLDSLDDRLFFTAQTVAEMESLFRRKVGEERQMLGAARKRLTSAKSSIADIRVSIEGVSDLDRLLLEIAARVDVMYDVYDSGYSAVANRLLALARRRSGPAYDAVTGAHAHAQARLRYDANLPPGYCDDAAWCARNNYTKGKPKEEPASFGDYLMWRQLLEHASHTRRSVLLVTNEKKPDWWHLDACGERVAPISTLREEMQRESGQGFYAITFDDFRRLAPKALQPAQQSPLVTSSRSVVRRPNGARTPAWMLIETARGPLSLHRFVAETDLISKYARQQMPFGLLGRARYSSASSAALRTYNDVAGLNRHASHFNSFISQATKVPTYIDALKAIDATKRFAILPERFRIMDEIKSGAFLARHAGLADIGKFGPTLRQAQRLMLQPHGIGRSIETARFATLGAEFVENERRMVRLALGDDAELIGHSAISHPRIREYAETHDLMDVPVRKVIVAMRDERLGRERDAQALAGGLR